MNSEQVVRAAGITYRQLDYWVRSGYVKASLTPSEPGSGNPRRWSDADLRRVIEVRDAMNECIGIINRVGIKIPAGWMRAIRGA